MSVENIYVVVCADATQAEGLRAKISEYLSKKLSHSHCFTYTSIDAHYAQTQEIFIHRVLTNTKNFCNKWGDNPGIQNIYWLFLLNDNMSETEIWANWGCIIGYFAAKYPSYQSNISFWSNRKISSEGSTLKKNLFITQYGPKYRRFSEIAKFIDAKEQHISELTLDISTRNSVVWDVRSSTQKQPQRDTIWADLNSRDNVVEIEDKLNNRIEEDRNKFINVERDSSRILP